jgi:hypothetical protein
MNAAGYAIQVDESPIVIEDNITLTLEVPEHINTNQLITLLRDRKVLEALTSNRDFQELDLRVKSRIEARTGRYNGV